MTSDKTSLELIYVYIKKYKIFTEQGFCLAPEYEVSCEKSKDLLSLKINKKENFVDLFEDEKINFTVICGKNGCGKSTLLEAIQKNDENIICVYKDKEDNFFATEKVAVWFENTKKHVEIVNGSFSKSINSSDFSMKNIVEYYDEKPELFGGIVHDTDKLFSHFRVKIWDLEEQLSKIKLDANSDFIKNLLSEIRDSKSEFEKNPFMLYALTNDVIINDFLSVYKSQKENDDRRSFSELFDEYMASGNSENYNEICNLQKQIFKNSYEIFNFDNVKAKTEKLEVLFQEVIKDISGYDGLKHNLFSYIYFDGYAEFEDTERHIEDLSSGELQKIKYRYQLFNVLEDKKATVCCFDEPETSLHPEWCRCFVNDFMESFEAVKEILKKNSSFGDKKISFIISTHSPFILSDLTNDNIIYLERKPDGTTTQKDKNDFKNAFAGNIGELFTANFFMDKTIGEFARSKIENIIKKFKADESIPAGEMNEYKQLIDCIGDDLLRTLLQDMLERKNEKN